MNTFQLELVALDRVFFKGESERVVLPATDGEQGILAGHAPLVVALRAGELRYLAQGKEQVVAVGHGFAEIMPQRVVVLTDFAERPEEIDVLRAQQEKEAAEESLRLQQSRLEYAQSRAQLAHAMAELKVAKRQAHR